MCLLLRLGVAGGVESGSGTGGVDEDDVEEEGSGGGSTESQKGSKEGGEYEDVEGEELGRGNAGGSVGIGTCTKSRWRSIMSRLEMSEVPLRLDPQ